MRLPGDKSMAHRALLFAALAKSPSRVARLPDGDDVACTIACLRALGTRIDVDGDTATVTPAPWSDPAAPLSCGNSGTLARLLIGALAGEAIDAELVGDASLSARPMRRVADPLRALFGVDVVELAAGSTLPARVHGSIAFAATEIRASSPGAAPSSDAPVRVETGVASAQVKQACVLAARAFGGDVDVVEPVPTRDHGERMLTAFGAPIATSAAPGGGRVVHVGAPFEWPGFDVDLPADPSSVALVAAYAIIAERRARFVDVLANPFRTAFVDVLRAAGVDIALASSSAKTHAGEPIADLALAAPSPLVRGIDVAAQRVPALIDDIPALAAVAVASPFESVFRGVGELRFKESDRVARLVDLARAFGADADVVDDTLRIRGRAARELRAVDRAVDRAVVRVRTDGDHRIAMAATALARAIGVAIELDVPGCERTSFPAFATFLARLDDEAAPH